MKTKLFMIGLISIAVSSCSFPGYLPTSDNIDVNEYGSYILLIRDTSSNIDGELIAIDSTQIVVLTEEAKKCVTVPISEVIGFSLKYAKSNQYGPSILILTLATIAHGYLLILTAPVNLIVTISVTASGANAFKYNDMNLTYEELKMFARFPQGIPPNIDLASLK